MANRKVTENKGLVLGLAGVMGVGGAGAANANPPMSSMPPADCGYDTEIVVPGAPTAQPLLPPGVRIAPAAAAPGGAVRHKSSVGRAAVTKSDEKPDEKAWDTLTPEEQAKLIASRKPEVLKGEAHHVHPRQEVLPEPPIPPAADTPDATGREVAGDHTVMVHHPMACPAPGTPGSGVPANGVPGIGGIPGIPGSGARANGGPGIGGLIPGLGGVGPIAMTPMPPYIEKHPPHHTPPTIEEEQGPGPAQIVSPTPLPGSPPGSTPTPTGTCMTYNLGTTGDCLHYSPGTPTPPVQPATPGGKTTNVPEPSSIAILAPAAGLVVGLAALGRRKREETRNFKERVKDKDNAVGPERVR